MHSCTYAWPANYFLMYFVCAKHERNKLLLFHSWRSIYLGNTAGVGWSHRLIWRIIIALKNLTHESAVLATIDHLISHWWSRSLPITWSMVDWGHLWTLWSVGNYQQRANDVGGKRTEKCLPYPPTTALMPSWCCLAYGADSIIVGLGQEAFVGHRTW